MDVFTRAGTENRMRWDRRSRGFMEVWYLTLNHLSSGMGVWLRYTLTSPLTGDPYCELWGCVFDPAEKSTFAAKERFPIDRLGAPNGRDDGALIRIGTAWLSEDHADGAIEGRDGTLSWSLDLEPADRCFQHVPAQLRGRAEKSLSVVCSPNLAVPFSGSVTVGDRELRFDRDPGCQSHRWGRRHPETWAWAHCSEFERQDATFEGLAARSGLGIIPGPTVTLLYLHYKGLDLVFNDLRSAVHARSRYQLPTWAFSAHNGEWRIVGAARAGIDRLVQAAYEDPDGTPRHCANSEIADLALEIYRSDPSGWVHDGSLIATRTAHLEFGRRRPFPELPVSV